MGVCDQPPFFKYIAGDLVSAHSEHNRNRERTNGNNQRKRKPKHDPENNPIRPGYLVDLADLGDGKGGAFIKAEVNKKQPNRNHNRKRNDQAGDQYYNGAPLRAVVMDLGDSGIWFHGLGLRTLAVDASPGGGGRGGADPDCLIVDSDTGAI